MAKDPGSKISRRHFAQVTAALAAATISPAGLFAQTEKASQPAAPSPSQEGTPLTVQQQAEVQAQAANIFRKYGGRFNDAQRADILRQLQEAQKPLNEVRAYPLENADGPATVLRIRGGGAGA